ncbi:MAG: chorismate-binding protein, partial [Desulfofustis sp.]
MTEPAQKSEFDRFCQRAEQARLVPLSTSLIADLDTPLTLFFKINPDREHVFLFESMEGGEKWGRYSFIGFQPLVFFACHGDSVEIVSYRGGRETAVRQTRNPLAALRRLVSEMDAFIDPNLPKFCGGAVGYLGYDMVRFIEDLPDTHTQLEFPDASFIVPGTVLIHDSLEQTVTIVHWIDTGAEEPLEQLYGEGRQHLDAVTGLINQPVPDEFFKTNGSRLPGAHEFKSNMVPEQYHRMVDRAREYILAGDIFQVVLSQRFHTSTQLPAHAIYRALRHINPSPYLFFLKLGDLIQIGSSPEILVRKEGERV